jgi:hypothetical protein
MPPKLGRQARNSLKLLQILVQAVSESLVPTHSGTEG